MNCKSVNFIKCHPMAALRKRYRKTITNKKHDLLSTMQRLDGPS